MSNHLIRSYDRDIAKARDRVRLNLDVHGRGSQQVTQAKAELERLESERYSLRCEQVGWDNVVGAI